MRFPVPTQLSPIYASSDGPVAPRRKVASDLKTVHGPTGLPADFLLSQDGTIQAMKYGRFADDSWTVDDLLAAAQTASRGTITNKNQLFSA